MRDSMQIKVLLLRSLSARCPEKVTYYINSKVRTDGIKDVTVTSADIELYKSESDELIQSWNGVTSFPYTIEAHGIDVPKGTVVITWYYTDASGNAGTSTQKKEISFIKE